MGEVGQGGKEEREEKGRSEGRKMEKEEGEEKGTGEEVEAEEGEDSEEEWVGGRGGKRGEARMWGREKE